MRRFCRLVGRVDLDVRTRCCRGGGSIGGGGGGGDGGDGGVGAGTMGTEAAWTEEGVGAEWVVVDEAAWAVLSHCGRTPETSRMYVM